MCSALQISRQFWKVAVESLHNVIQSSSIELWLSLEFEDFSGGRTEAAVALLGNLTEAYEWICQVRQFYDSQLTCCTACS